MEPEDATPGRFRLDRRKLTVRNLFGMISSVGDKKPESQTSSALSIKGGSAASSFMGSTLHAPSSPFDFHSPTDVNASFPPPSPPLLGSGGDASSDFDSAFLRGSSSIPFQTHPQSSGFRSGADSDFMRSDTTSADAGRCRIDPLRMIGASHPVPLGLGGTIYRLFAFDPLLQILVFVTGHGDLRVFGLNWEFTAKNSVSTNIRHIDVVPGLGRVVTAGATVTTALDKPSTEVIQIWDLPTSVDEKTPDNSPSTINVSATVQHLKRCTSYSDVRYDTGSSAVLCVAAPEKRRSSRGSIQEPLSSLSGFTSADDPQAKSVWAAKCAPHDSTEGHVGPSLSEFIANRDLFFIGSDDGNVRILDSAKKEFLASALCYGAVCTAIDALHSVVGPVPLRSVRFIAPHPNTCSRVLIAYANCVIVEWDFRLNTAVCAYYCMAKPVTVNSAGQSDGTVFLPSSCGMPVGRVLLESLVWHPAGYGFAAAVNSATYGPGASGKEPVTSTFDPRVFVYVRNHPSPILMVSLEHVTQASLQNSSFPFMHWEVPPSCSIDSTSNLSNPSVLLKASQLYVLSTPHPSQADDASPVTSRSQPTGTRQQASGATGHSNVWRLSSNLWGSGSPVFPQGAIHPGSEAACTIGAAAIFQPFYDKMSLPQSAPFAASIAGLSDLNDVEKDSGEDAETVLAAAKKLTNYLMSGTFILAVTNFPSRQIIGACISMNQTLYKRYSSLLKTTSPRSPPSPASASRREYESTTSGDDDHDFAPWNNLRKPLLFQVEWSSLLMSNLTTALSFSRHFPSHSRRIRPMAADPSTFTEIDEDIFMKLCNYTDLQNESSAAIKAMQRMCEDDICTSETAFCAARQKANDCLDSLVDALYTVRRKHVVHGWLSALSSQFQRIYIGCIPMPAEDADDSERRPRLQSEVESSSDLAETSDDLYGNNVTSCSESDEDDLEEWRSLNENLFFGDLFRVASSSWGTRQSVLGAYQGLIITGHSDGKVRVWVQLCGGIHLIHSVSVQSSVSYFPYSTPIAYSSKAFANHHQHERADTQCIGSVDAKPALCFIPELPIVSVVDVFFSGAMRDHRKWTSESHRFVVVGCLTGEISVFQWFGAAQGLSNTETDMFWNRVKEAPRPDAPSTEVLREDVASSLLPFGFQMVLRSTVHSSRVIAIAIRSCPAPASAPMVNNLNVPEGAASSTTGDDGTPTRRSRRGQTMGLLSAMRNVIVGLADEVSETQSASAPSSRAPSTPNLAALAAKGSKGPKTNSVMRVIAADKSGRVTVTDVTTGQVLCDYRLADEATAAESSGRTIRSREPEAFVELIGRSNYPLVFSPECRTEPDPPRGDATGDQPDVETYAVVLFNDGRLRQCNLTTGRFLDKTRYGGVFDPNTGKGITGVASNPGMPSAAAPTPRWHLFEEIKIGSKTFRSLALSTDNIMTTAKPLFTRKLPRDARADQLRWFVIVQSFWVALLEFRYDSTTTTYTYAHCKAFNLDRQVLSAQLTFIENLPSILIILKGGKCATVAIHPGTTSDLLSPEMSLLGFTDMYQGGTTGPAAEGQNLGVIGWAANSLVAKRDKTCTAPVYLCDFFAPRRMLNDAWRRMVSRQLRSSIAAYDKIWQDDAGEAKPSTPRSTPTGGKTWWGKVTKWAQTGQPNQRGQTFSLRNVCGGQPPRGGTPASPREAPPRAAITVSTPPAKKTTSNAESSFMSFRFPKLGKTKTASHSGGGGERKTSLPCSTDIYIPTSENFRETTARGRSRTDVEGRSVALGTKSAARTEDSIAGITDTSSQRMAATPVSEAINKAQEAKNKLAMNQEALKSTAHKTEQMASNAKEFSELAAQLRKKF